MMRRVFPLFLLTLTPFLANCADSATPVAPAGALHSEEHVATAEHELTEADWLTDQNWWTPNDAIVLAEAEADVSMQATAAGEPVVMTFGRRDPDPDAPTGLYRRMIRPHAVHIPVGGKVTFKGIVAHRVAIYDNGMKPQDIPDANPGNIILYPVNRLFLQPAAAPEGITLTFTKQGNYLVLCAVKRHFFEEKQWAWIHVA
jgi:plastocyanin